MAEAAEEVRDLCKVGKIEWSDLSPLRVLDWMSLDEPPVNTRT